MILDPPSPSFTHFVGAILGGFGPPFCPSSPISLTGSPIVSLSLPKSSRSTFTHQPGGFLGGWASRSGSWGFQKKWINWDSSAQAPGKIESDRFFMVGDSFNLSCHCYGNHCHTAILMGYCCMLVKARNVFKTAKPTTCWESWGRQVLCFQHD